MQEDIARAIQETPEALTPEAAAGNGPLPEGKQPSS